MPDKYNQLDDNAIIRLVKAGDINAFEALLTKYKTHVLKIVLKHLPRQQAEETAQDIFVKAYQSLSKFEGKSEFKYWLSGIAVKSCYEFWRKAYKAKEVSLSSLTEKQQAWLEHMIADDANALFMEKNRRDEAKEVLDWALNRLSAEDRMILELVYLEELPLKEVAEMLGWSMANVKVRSFRARKKLEKLLHKTASGGKGMA